jgi:hypothetical protein
MKRKLPKTYQLTDLISAVLADGEAAHEWAEICGWVPGTGRCQRQPTLECRAECFFHAMRAEEARSILRQRRRRRAMRRPGR